MARIYLGCKCPILHSCVNTEHYRRLLGIDQPRQRGTLQAHKANLFFNPPIGGSERTHWVATVADSEITDVGLHATS